MTSREQRELAKRTLWGSAVDGPFRRPTRWQRFKKFLKEWLVGG